MKVVCALIRTSLVRVISSIVVTASVSHACGRATATMIAAITVTKTLNTAHTIRVVLTSSDVPTVGVYLKLGNVIMKMTVKTDLMKLDVFIHHAQMGSLLVQTPDVLLCHKYAMVLTTAKITRLRMKPTTGARRI